MWFHLRTSLPAPISTKLAITQKTPAGTSYAALYSNQIKVQKYGQITFTPLSKVWLSLLGRETDHSSHPVRGIGMSGLMPPLPHTPLWPAMGQLYFISTSVNAFIYWIHFDILKLVLPPIVSDRRFKLSPNTSAVVGCRVKTLCDSQGPKQLGVRRSSHPRGPK
jgi:hypothetical protein